MSKALAGEQLLDYEVAAYQSAIMDFPGGLYAWTRALLCSPYRRDPQSEHAALPLDRRGYRLRLDWRYHPCRLLAAPYRLYGGTRQAAPHHPLHAQRSGQRQAHCRSGLLPDESTAGKIQFGSAWWFNDHFDGMTAQLKSLANIGVLSRFVGMLTDSRSFLSLSAPRIFPPRACELVGGWIASGMAPADYDGIGKIIEDICFNNIWQYIGLE